MIQSSAPEGFKFRCCCPFFGWLGFFWFCFYQLTHNWHKCFAYKCSYVNMKRWHDTWLEVMYCQNQLEERFSVAKPFKSNIVGQPTEDWKHQRKSSRFHNRLICWLFWVNDGNVAFIPFGGVHRLASFDASKSRNWISRCNLRNMTKPVATTGLGADILTACPPSSVRYRKYLSSAETDNHATA